MTVCRAQPSDCTPLARQPSTRMDWTALTLAALTYFADKAQPAVAIAMIVTFAHPWMMARPRREGVATDAVVAASNRTFCSFATVIGSSNHNFAIQFCRACHCRNQHPIVIQNDQRLCLDTAYLHIAVEAQCCATTEAVPPGNRLRTAYIIHSAFQTNTRR